MTGNRPLGKTNLMTACEQGRTLEAKIILQKKPQSISTRDKHGKTALHYAAESGSLPCAQLLVSGADRTLLDSPDSEGFTPLHLAIISGHRAIARLLLRAGADPDAVDKERHSAIHWATVCGDIESLDILLHHGASPSTPDILGACPIHYAAQMCGAHALNGKDPETGLNTLRRLVEKGASIQCRDRDGREPLLWAASAGSSEAVLILFAAGANVSASDKDGLTALHCAASRGHTNCLETLITLCGARIDAGDHIGCSPLFYAAAQGQADCAQVLLKHCSDPNRQDDKGRTPAHCASLKGRLEVLRILDSNGADLWIRNSRGNLPLHEAVVSGRKDLVHWLLQQAPRAVNATNLSGRTPLHIAAECNNVEMCEVLIDYGAFVNPLMVNPKGFLMTPLDVSVYQGNQRCAKYLQLHGAVPATKVLENNEINRNLLFSLGTYAYHHKDRSDEEPSSAPMFDLVKDGPQQTNGRDTQTRTIRGGQQPPLPQNQVPPESELTNVMSEDVTDASVHIHLTRDDLWSLWESLMQELTSEMSGSELSQGSEQRHKSKRRTSEVKQLKPILTNVYLRRENSSSQVIAGESILDNEIATRSVSEDTKLRYPKRATDELKISLPKVSEAEKVKSTEGKRRTSSSKISGMDIENRDRQTSKNETTHNNISDSVGSDTEHKSAMRDFKAIRLRKRRSDGRTWVKEAEESETSSGNKQEGLKENNPYLKRYFQKQARAVEMRKYMETQNPENDDVFRDYHNPDHITKKKVSEKYKKTMSYDDMQKAEHHQQSASLEHGKSSHHKKDRKHVSGEDLHAETSNRSHHKRSKSPSYEVSEKTDLHLRHPKEHKHRSCDCIKNASDDVKDRKENWHSESCRFKKRHGMETHQRTGRKKRGTSPTHTHLNRKGSRKFLEVPSQLSVATPIASDERSDDVPHDDKIKLRHHHYHHHHHHHHHHRHQAPFEKELSLDGNHRFERHKHKRHFHRRKSWSRERSYSVGHGTERTNFSDGEYEKGEEGIYSGNNIQRSKSEMSDFPWYTSRDVLTQSPVPEVGEGESLLDMNNEEECTTNKSKMDNYSLAKTSRLEKSEASQQHKIELHKRPKSSLKADYARETDDLQIEQIHQKHELERGQRVVKSDPSPEAVKPKAKFAKKETSLEKKQKSQELKSDKRKTEHGKNSNEIVNTTTNSSPRKESKKPGKPPFRAAQSFSEVLSHKTKDITLKPKSQSARIEKNLPEIKVFSAEGKETKFLVRNELSEVNEGSEISSSNVNQQKSNDSEEITLIKEQCPIDTTRNVDEVDHDIEVSVYLLKNESQLTAQSEVEDNNNEKKLNIVASAELLSIKNNANEDSEQNLKISQEKDVLKSCERNENFSESESEDDGEPDEILYRDENAETEYLQRKNYVIEIEAEVISESKEVSQFKTNLISNETNSENKQEQKEDKLSAKEHKESGRTQNQTESRMDLKDKEEQQEKQTVVISDPSRKKEEDVESSDTKMLEENFKISNSRQNIQINKTDIDKEESYYQKTSKTECIEISSTATDHPNISDNEKDADKLELNNEELEADKTNNEIMDKNEMQLMQEVARDHIINIIQKAESEIEKFKHDGLEIEESSEINVDRVSLSAKPKPELETSNLGHNVVFKITKETPNNEESEVKEPKEDHFSDPESSSEAETKFNTDSEEVQPEPDLVYLLSEEDKSFVLVDESCGKSDHLEASPKISPPKSKPVEWGEEKTDTNPVRQRSIDLIQDEGSSETRKIIVTNESAVKQLEASTESLDSSHMEQAEEMMKKGIDNKNINTNELNMFRKSARRSKLEPPYIMEGKEKDNLTSNTNIKYYPSAEVQTDFSDIGVFEGVVNFQREENNLVGFSRSISVQTSDFDHGMTLLKKMKNVENKIATNKHISVQTEISGVKKGAIKDHSDEIKQAIMTANYNDISKKSRLAPEIVENNTIIKESSKPPNSTDTVQRSPERQNPGAVFYKANNDMNKESPRSEQNVSAMFYTTGSMMAANSKSNTNLYAESKSSMKQTEIKQKDSRLTVRDRSLESERAVAVANTAFHRLNSKGELTVFNSSQIMRPQNVPTVPNTSSEIKPSCQRRGETYSNLQKRGFLWVHFGSGSSPISTLKRKPNLTSQKMKREFKYIKNASSSVSKTVGDQHTKVVPNYRTGKRNEGQSKIAVSNSLKTKPQKRVAEEAKRSPARKSNADLHDPALQVSSKVLIDKKLKNLSHRKDSLKDDSPNKHKSKIPYLSEHEVKLRDDMDKAINGQDVNKKNSVKVDNRTKGKTAETAKMEPSPRIPRLCNQNSFIIYSAENIPKDSKHFKKYEHFYQDDPNKYFNIDKNNDSIVGKSSKRRKEQVKVLSDELDRDGSFDTLETNNICFEANAFKDNVNEASNCNKIHVEHPKDGLYHDDSSEKLEKGQDQLRKNGSYDNIIDANSRRRQDPIENVGGEEHHNDRLGELEKGKNPFEMSKNSDNINGTNGNKTLHTTRNITEEMHHEDSFKVLDETDNQLDMRDGCENIIEANSKEKGDNTKNIEEKVHHRDNFNMLKTDDNQLEISESNDNIIETSKRKDHKRNIREEILRDGHVSAVGKEYNQHEMNKSDDNTTGEKKVGKKNVKVEIHRAGSISAPGIDNQLEINKRDDNIIKVTNRERKSNKRNIRDEVHRDEHVSAVEKEDIQPDKNKSDDNIIEARSREIREHERNIKEELQRNDSCSALETPSNQLEVNEENTRIKVKTGPSQEVKGKSKRSKRRSPKKSSKDTRMKDVENSSQKTYDNTTKKSEKTETNNEIGQKNTNNQQREKKHDGRDDNNSNNLRPNGDPNDPYPRLSETAKSSSLEEGDVKLIIERKADPDFSIKIRMSDKSKKSEKPGEVYSTDLSSTQCESDQSYIKDSGYISTTESIHRHKRSITIDLGHTTAKINAGFRNDANKDISKGTEKPKVSLPEVSERNHISNTQNRNGNQNTLSTSQKVLPSKLPILSGRRERSNSMVLMNYHRTPRRNSVSTDIREHSENEKTSTEENDLEQRGLAQNGYISRQIEDAIEKSTGKSSRGDSAIYRTQSDSCLQDIGKSTPRISDQSLSSSIPEMDDGYIVRTDRKMSGIIEQSRLSTEIPAESSKTYSETVTSNATEQFYSRTDTIPDDSNEKYDERANSIDHHGLSPNLDSNKNIPRTPDNMKLPSILLFQPGDTDSVDHQRQKDSFPTISSLSSNRTSPVRSGFLSPDVGSLKLPILQRPVRCKCRIEPHQYWDGRRTKSAVDCVANLHFLNEEEIAQFDQRLLAISRRSSYSSGRKKTPQGLRALRTQTLKRMKSGRKSVESVIFHVDHDKERNSFKLPTGKLRRNKKWQVTFTIGKSEGKNKKRSSVRKKPD